MKINCLKIENLKIKQNFPGVSFLLTLHILADALRRFNINYKFGVQLQRLLFLICFMNGDERGEKQTGKQG